jgi:hypothetical protein
MNGEDRLQPSLAGRMQMSAAELANPGMLVIDFRTLFGEQLPKPHNAVVWHSAMTLRSRGHGIYRIGTHHGASNS